MISELICCIFLYQMENLLYMKGDLSTRVATKAATRLVQVTRKHRQVKYTQVVGKDRPMLESLVNEPLSSFT